MSAVILKNLSKSFGKVEVLHNINLEIKDNEFTVFVGPSGCGKSTLLRLIAGLEDVTQGEILIGDTVVNNLPPAKRGIAMVFQSYALYPHMTVYENIAFGLKRSKYAKSEINRRVLEAAESLQVEKYLDRKPKQLSGGQRQRVAIGRAIVKDPKVFLFDEPLSNLDAALRVNMRMLIARLKRKLNATTIYVTHDQVEAMTLADKIVVLRNGYIEQVGSPLYLYHHPRNKFVAGFLGSPQMNFLGVHIAEISSNTITVQLPHKHHLALPLSKPLDMENVKEGSAVTLGVRPENVAISTKEDADLEGKIRVVENLGSETYAYVKVQESMSLLVRVQGDYSLKVGDYLYLKLDPHACHLFHGETGLSFERPALISE